MRILCAKRSLTWLPLAVSALRWQTLASLSTGDRVRSGAYHGFIPSKSYVHHSRTNAMEGNSTDLLPAEINPTVFDSIVDGTIPSKKVYEDDLVCFTADCFMVLRRFLAFHDINPVAPVHILVIPKKRDGLSRLSRATEDHAKILGHMMVKVAQIVRDNNIGDYRLVVNDGPGGGQRSTTYTCISLADVRCVGAGLNHRTLTGNHLLVLTNV